MANKALEEDMEPLSGGDSGNSGDEDTGDSDSAGSESLELDGVRVDPLDPVVSPLKDVKSVWDDDELASLVTAESSPSHLGVEDEVATKMLELSVNSNAVESADSSLPPVVYHPVSIGNSPCSNDSAPIDLTEGTEEVVASQSNDQTVGISADALVNALNSASQNTEISADALVDALTGTTQSSELSQGEKDKLAMPPPDTTDKALIVPKMVIKVETPIPVPRKSSGLRRRRHR